MNLLTKRVVGVVVAMGLLAGGTALWARGQQESANHPSLPKPTSVIARQVDVLKGLKGVYVLVEALDPAETTIDLTKDRIRAVTEMALRRNGIRVLTFEEIRGTRGNPFVYVSVGMGRTSFNVSVDFKENVRLERSPTTQVLSATVWNANVTGTHGGDADSIIKSLDELVDEFCNDYLKANPEASKNLKSSDSATSSRASRIRVSSSSDVRVEARTNTGNDADKPKSAEPTSQPDVVLPAELKKRQFTGRIVVEVTVDVDGSHEETLIQGSGDAEIDKVVMQALRGWKWRPAYRDGEKVKSTKKFQYNIRINPD